MDLTPDQREYILIQWRLLRQANAKAAHHSREWNRLNEGIEQWLDGMNIHDIVQRVKVKGESLELKGNLDAWSFWEREAKRIHAAISGELMCTMALAGQGFGSFVDLAR